MGRVGSSINEGPFQKPKGIGGQGQPGTKDVAADRSRHPQYPYRQEDVMESIRYAICLT